MMPYKGRILSAALFHNTLGAIVGSWVAGFALIPLLGMQKSLVATALLSAAVGGILLARGAGERRRLQVAVAAGVLVLFVAVDRAMPELRFTDIAGEPEREILYYDEGVAGMEMLFGIRHQVPQACTRMVVGAQVMHIAKIALDRVGAGSSTVARRGGMRRPWVSCSRPRVPS
jgi:hypothetical protein